MKKIKVEKIISTTKAIQVVKDMLGITVTLPTIITWGKLYGFSFRIPDAPYGRWKMNERLLKNFLKEASEKNQRQGKKNQR
jgi:hypothetical protein